MENPQPNADCGQAGCGLPEERSQRGTAQRTLLVGVEPSEELETTDAESKTTKPAELEQEARGMIASEMVNAVAASGLSMRISVEGTDLDVLVDTGATVSVVSAELARERGTPVSPWTGGSVKLPDGARADVRGKVTMRLQIGRTELAWTFVVFEKLCCSMIAGLDLLNACGARIDLENQTVVMAGCVLALGDQEARERVEIPIRLAEAVTLEARSESFVPVLFDHERADHIRYAVVQPLEEVWEQNRCRLANGFVEQLQPVCLRLLNAGLATQLAKGTRVGTAIPIGGSQAYLQVVETEQATPGTPCKKPPWSEAELEEKVQRAHLEDEEKNILKEFLRSEVSAFAVDPKRPGVADVPAHRIDTGDAVPIKLRPYRSSHHERGKLDEEVEIMHANGTIRQSQSPWAAPAVLVMKKDGDLRFCVDYRRLNALTRKDSYPLPRIDETLESLVSMRYFSTLDLASGYWQIPVAEEDKPKTAFTTGRGLWEFNVLPFGLSNGPATFQRTMDVVLAGLRFDVCLVYLDDVIVYSATFAEHLERLKLVFARLRSAKLHLKFKKCNFCLREIEFLGHVVGRDGLRTDPKKIEAVRAMRAPTDLASLRSFLGLASYYRRFVNRFAEIAEPLTKLQRKGERFVWTPECEASFVKLKERLTSAPVLAYPDFKLPFVLYTDACKEGLGATLGQIQNGKEVVIGYASRTTQKAERNYGITELECLGAIWGTKQFRPYLYGRKFQLVTDHSALKWLLSLKEPVGRLGRWALWMQQFEFEVVHRQGRLHNNVDPLSRAPLIVNGLVADEPDTTAEQQRADPELGPVIRLLEDNELPDDPELARKLVKWAPFFGMQNGRLMYIPDPKKRQNTALLALPKATRSTVLYQMHDDVFAGHLSTEAVYAKLRERFWWPRMYRDTREWVESCPDCQTKKTPRKPRAGLLQAISVLERWHTVGVDIVGPLPRTSRKNRYLVVFCDYMTKWPEAFAVRDADAATVGTLLADEIMCRYGAPARLLSDRGKVFLSNVVGYICQLFGVKKLNTTAYHPQTDGLVERFNHTLVEMLSQYVNEHQTDWDVYVGGALFAYRTAKQRSTGVTPAMLMFGRELRQPLDEALQLTRPGDASASAAEIARKIQSNVERAKESLARSREAQARYYNAHRRHVTFQVGDKVLWFKPMRRQGLVAKLAHQWNGPYVVAEVVNDVLYRLQSLNGRLVRELANVVTLKPYHETVDVSEGDEDDEPWVVVSDASSLSSDEGSSFELEEEF